MRIDGTVEAVNDNRILINFNPDKITNSQKFLLKNNIGSDVESMIDDGRCITKDQRNKAWAMMNDISNYSGNTRREVEEAMKIRYLCQLRFPKWFSLSNCSIQTAKEFIEFLIAFCIQWGIPFTTKVFDEIQQSYKLRVQMLKHRICYVCGRPHADVDHVQTIGAGRNRRHVNQVGMWAWSLCRHCHQLRHSMGIKSFMQRYQVKPVKLTPELIEYLNLSNKGAIGNEKKV